MNTTNLTPKSYIFSEKWQKTYKQKHLVSESSLKKKKNPNELPFPGLLWGQFTFKADYYTFSFGNCKIVTLRHKKDCKTLYVRNVD